MSFIYKSEHTARRLIGYIFLYAILIGAGGCRAVKDWPRGVPFVYKNEINLKAKGLTNEERSVLETKLYGYLDDSLQVPIKYVLGFSQRIKPPRFDTASIIRSINFINGYLNSQGYYAATFDTFTVEYNTKHKMQWRAIVRLNINIGKNLRVDTVVYALDTPMVAPLLQLLADSTRKNALLRKNSAYSKDAVALEMDRLAALFRSRGFLKMSRAALIVEADTTDPSLVSFDSDPIEQLLEAQRRKVDPTIKLVFRQRTGLDSMVFKQFYVDSVILYPDRSVTDEPGQLMQDSSLTTIAPLRRNFIIRQKKELFIPKVLRRNNYIRPGDIYNEESYFRTLNTYWKMGPWQQVEVETVTRMDTVPKVNFHIFLTPAKKYSSQIDLEGSQNNSISSSTALSGKFLALSLNGTLYNRNNWKRAIQSTTSGRFGFELNNSFGQLTQFFQTLIISANHSISIPRLIWPFQFLDTRKVDATRTSVNGGISYTDRFNFFKQQAYNANLQWERRMGSTTATFTFPNFESVNITETDSLRNAILANPSLQYAFTPGHILSAKMSLEKGLSYPHHPRQSGYVRVALEVSPFKFKVFNQNSFQFAKTEIQFVHANIRRKISLHYRAYAGYGFNFSLRNNPQATMPYFRQYVAGGSNSMRAWGLRQLGLGYSTANDTARYPDRFGDIQFETNAEMRFKMFRLFGFNFGGAVFADLGNVWNHSNNADGYGKLEIKNVYRDIALCIGSGIRWDISYLVIRLDAGYKLKDPVRGGNGWPEKIEWRSTNRLGTHEQSNVGFQFGIGYPF